MLVAPFRIVLLWPIPWLVACAVPPVIAGEPVKFGGIEIGSKGIKMVAVPIDHKGAPDLAKKNLTSAGVSNVTLADRDSKGNFRPEAIAEAAAAVANFHRLLSGDLKIPPERLWVVASSGLTSNGPPGNMDVLRKAVADATGGEEQMIEIDQRKEVELLVRGVIPRDRWGDSILLDVGSGNAKIGYIEPEVGINVEKCQVLSTKVEGTVTFTKTLQAERTKRKLKGFPAYQELAKEFRSSIEERIEEDLGRSAGLKNRPRIYISGGAIWAIATLTNPEEVISQDLYVNFSLKRLREFQDKLRASGKIELPDLAGLPLTVREKATKEIQAVRDAFSVENLLAGSEILLGFAEVLDWENPGKEVLFAKSGVVAWIVGYVELERK